MANVATYQSYADKMAAKHRIPKWAFRALVSAESNWDPDARSPVGAMNLTQLMPGTAKGLGVDPTDWRQALEGGARYLRQQLDAFGTLRLALAAYNAGPGNVANGRWQTFSETTRYVRKILAQKPTDVQQLKRNPRKQVATIVTPPPAALLPSQAGAPTLAPDTGAAETAAFEGLGRIARGESPTRTLSTLVDAVASTPTSAPRAAAPAAVGPTPRPISPAAPVTPTRSPTPQRSTAKLKGGGGWGGSYDVARTLATLGFSRGLKAVSEKRDRRGTKSGGVSDHWTGKKNAYAFDLSNGGAPTPEMDAAAVDIARRLGVSYDGKSPLVLTVKRDGYRIQVLYRTQVGGNHDDHIHLGVEKLP